MISPRDIESRLGEGLPGCRVEVQDLTGGGDHYRVTVVSEQFRDKLPVARHRMVYAIFEDVLGGALHALSLETLTPEELQDRLGQGAGSGSLPRL